MMEWYWVVLIAALIVALREFVIVAAVLILMLALALTLGAAFVIALPFVIVCFLVSDWWEGRQKGR